ncbi:hypothetical protein A2130_04275 [Candidatus Woesebacteria bacterium GWC2_33_12]|nr:MAG: hypothetical protein A2130_04275 [Candidatus Woesebacteria bacterium GWC2_33_12]
MTLKQFFQVAGGVVISLIFYSLPLHGLIKWPLILISAGLGAAMAFLPFQERPLEKWIIAFFRSIYSPTLYSWKKTEKPVIFFTETAVAPAVGVVPIGQTSEPNTKKLEEAEKSFLTRLTSIFQMPIANSQQSTVVQTQTPATNNQQSTIQQQIPTLITHSAPRLVVEETGSNKQTGLPVNNILITKVEEKEITTNPAEFSIDAAPPAPPTVINTIVGQVMDMDRKIIEGAILEIKDANGRPVRALKSNKAGHFIIVTPLANGKYEISTEKDGFTFEPISFETKGEIIPAIAIRGTRI